MIISSVVLSSLGLGMGCAMENEISGELAEPELSAVEDMVDAQPITINGTPYKNQREFIESGRRCGSHVSDAEQARMEADFDERTLQDNNRVNVTGGVIPVYWHVITNATGQGAPTAQQITDQMNVLNAAFASTGWSFSLVSTDTTANNTWYTATPGTTAETQMKNALRQGSADDLNLYTNNMGSGLLGHFPQQLRLQPQDGRRGNPLFVPARRHACPLQPG